MLTDAMRLHMPAYSCICPSASTCNRLRTCAGCGLGNDPCGRLYMVHQAVSWFMLTFLLCAY
jgi:hypothetical protein